MLVAVEVGFKEARIETNQRRVIRGGVVRCVWCDCVHDGDDMGGHCCVVSIRVVVVVVVVLDIFCSCSLLL